MCADGAGQSTHEGQKETLGSQGIKLDHLAQPQTGPPAETVVENDVTGTVFMFFNNGLFLHFMTIRFESLPKLLLFVVDLLQAYTSVSKASLSLADHRELGKMMNTIIFHTKMVDSLVEMLVETSDLSIFWYVIIFFKSQLVMFII